MKTPEVIVVDFETKAIEGRPAYPPEPVGVAIMWPGKRPCYLPWGHADSNNTILTIAREELRRVWRSKLPVLTHNSKFDLAVITEKLGFPMLPWERIHDTMFFAYLCDPHARSLDLKQLAADILDWPPDEQDAVNDWVWAHRKELEAEYGGAVKKSQLGAWIWACPGDIVAPYAIGDVERTKALFEHMWPLVQEHRMGEAYDRERQLLPILMENERVGMRVDLALLESDIVAYTADLETAEGWLRKELKASGLNFDADQDVIAVLQEREAVYQDQWQRTAPTKRHPNGQISISKDNLRPEAFVDPCIASALGYRNRLVTCLKMFMLPWAEQARKRDGYISTNWNQVRNPSGGTRTGRPSTSDPNFLNISKDFEDKSDGYGHPTHLPVVPLPLVRKYILPDKGEVFLHRDFDGQELRVFAHGEQGSLFDAYQANPNLDPHGFVAEELTRLTGETFDRTKVKTLNFQALYGGGVPAAAKKLNCSLAAAKTYKAFHDRALPGRQLINDEIKRIVRRGEPIRTWGGRLYFPETPRVVGDRLRDFEYKLINYWIQGSAADLTKQALIDWYNDPERTARFLVTVYDEINISTKPGEADRQMEVLRRNMEKQRLTVPMLSSGKRGLSWGSLEKCR